MTFPVQTAPPLVSVITPLWNEEQIVPALAAALHALFSVERSVRWEWVAIDDGSTDGTAARLRECFPAFERWHLVRLSRNFGQQAACRAGLDHAKGDAVVFLDGDLQDPPDEIIPMLRAWRDGGARLVVGCRRSRPEKGLRGAMFRLFHHAFSRMTREAMPFNSGTFGLMDRVIVERVRALPEVNLFLPALRNWVGSRREIVWYDRQERKGTARQTYRKLFSYAWDGITSFSDTPLQLITWLGLFICVASFCYAGVLVFIKILQWFGRFESLVVPGFTTLAVAVLFVGGLQMLCLGVLGTYQARIYREVKRRPHYLVDEVDEFVPAGEAV